MQLKMCIGSKKQHHHMHVDFENKAFLGNDNVGAWKNS